MSVQNYKPKINCKLHLRIIDESTGLAWLHIRIFLARFALLKILNS
jgi:hypothetical protein